MPSLFAILSDLLLLAAALGAGTYCLILSRRLTRLSSIDKGLGGAIAVLSAQVDDLTRALADAREGSEATADRLTGLIAEAERLGNDIEEMLAGAHDVVPEPAGIEAQFGTRRLRTDPDEMDATPVFRRRATVAEAAE